MPRARKPKSGYAIVQEALRALDDEMAEFGHTREGLTPRDALNTKANLGRAIAMLQAELRRTTEDAQSAVAALSAERQAELVLRLVKGLSPEFREAVGQLVIELRGKLLT